MDEKYSFTSNLFLLQLVKTERGVFKCSIINSNFHLDKPADISNGDIVIYTDDVEFDYLNTYKVEFVSLPYDFKKNMYENMNFGSLYVASQQLFSKYCEMAETVRSILREKYQNIYFFCSIFSFDFCLLVSENEKNYDLQFIKNEILNFFNKTPKEKNLIELDAEKEYLSNRIKRNRCILDDRKFVVYNPRFIEYIETMNAIDKVKTDSFDRKQELSLFGTLVVKDLTEETHLNWLYETGEPRHEITDMASIITEQNKRYFKYFNDFAKQASDDSAYSDWVWALVFLTQTLLFNITNNTIDHYDESFRFNFFGFVPIIGDYMGEVCSFYSRHISRKFCHGFLSIPKESIYNLPEYFPAYIHEFFHYIPPHDRIIRNKVILELILHSVLFKISNNVDKRNYDLIFTLFKNEIIEETKKYGFAADDFFSCDSMEYSERLNAFFYDIDFASIYTNFKIKIKDENISNIYEVVSSHEDFCISLCKNHAKDFIRIFVLFFREIRSDIAMCRFFDIDLKQYIKILAQEPVFAFMAPEDCADSTILRFGFMCRYLFQRNTKTNPSSWCNFTCSIIDELIKEDNSKKNHILRNYENLKGYLMEYNKGFIEHNSGCYTPKGESMVENILCQNKIVSEWETHINRYAKQPFSNDIKELYKEYVKANPTERLKSICGIRLLFRDLTLFNFYN